MSERGEKATDPCSSRNTANRTPAVRALCEATGVPALSVFGTGVQPDNIIPKIVEGRVKSFFEDNVLYDQKFVNTEKFEGTVEDLVNNLALRMGENISVRRIARLSIGEQD